MSLKDLNIEMGEYIPLKMNIAKDFYIPLLKESICYKRAVGFFGSAVLLEISQGISQLIKNGGSIKIIASPKLSEEDIEAINKGYEEREKILENVLARELRDPKNYFEEERLNLLANLIAEGRLDLKIALTKNETGIGMYHEKLGIVDDRLGNKVVFSGSNNATLCAMYKNYEVMDVYPSWTSNDSYNLGKQKEERFNRMWENNEDFLEVHEFKAINKKIIEKYKTKEPNFEIDNIEFKDSASEIKCKIIEKNAYGARVPNDINLFEYQIEAINSWQKSNYRGVFDMATGTGKTYTSLAALSRLSESLDDKLAVIIVCPFQHLVEQWVEDINRFNMNPIIGYSKSFQKDWKQRLKKAILEQKTRKDKPFFCFICTNATFASNFVQESISKIKSKKLIIVDEAHNIGAKTYIPLLKDEYEYRLGLSATLDRYGDSQGTEMLYNFFGKKCIEYSLEKAIDDKKLTEYFYIPVIINLNSEELEKYENISLEMSKHIVKDQNGKNKLDSYGEILAIKRSRVIAAAKQKIDVLKIKMQPYINEHFILVYCGSTNVLKNNSDSSETDVDDIRQIEEVVRVLGTELNMKVSKFTSEEDIYTRNEIKNHFKNGDDLQCIAAIKCLDEGVNIPAIKTAFILASTTNPKEYIQRRGRVLRKSPETGKEYAEIYDFITLPRSLEEVPYLTEIEQKGDISLVKRELKRVYEFARLSKNKTDGLNLVWDVCEKYNINLDFEKGDVEQYE